jgi:putative membrane protein
MMLALCATQKIAAWGLDFLGLILPMDQLGNTVLVTLAFAIIGILLFALAFWIIAKISPISIAKELEEEQNTALAIVIGSVIIGIALIVSAAIHG